MTATLSQVLAVANWSRDDFNNWKRRGTFWTKMPQALPGVAQKLSRENALEVAFLAAITQIRVHPWVATLEVARWLKEEKSGKLAPAWATTAQAAQARARTGKPLGQSFSNFAKANVRKLAIDLQDESTRIDQQGEAARERQAATVLMLIDRAEIVRRIDALFEN